MSALEKSLEWEKGVKGRLEEAGFELGKGSKRIVVLTDEYAYKIPMLLANNFSSMFEYEHYSDRPNTKKFDQTIKRGPQNNLNEVQFSTQFSDLFLHPSEVAVEMPRIVSDILDETQDHHHEIAQEYSNDKVIAVPRENIMVVRQERLDPIDEDLIESFFGRYDDFTDKYSGDREMGAISHDVASRKNWGINSEGRIKSLDYGHDGWDYTLTKYGKELLGLIEETEREFGLGK